MSAGSIDDRVDDLIARIGRDDPEAGAILRDLATLADPAPIATALRRFAGELRRYVGAARAAGLVAAETIGLVDHDPFGRPLDAAAQVALVELVNGLLLGGPGFVSTVGWEPPGPDEGAHHLRAVCLAGGVSGTLRTGPPAPDRSPSGAAPIRGLLLETEAGGSALVVGPVPAVLGRGPSTAAYPGAQRIVVDDPDHHVSHTHLALGVEPRGAWIDDLHSTNGVAVVDADGRARRVVAGGREPLADGASIRIAGLALRVRLLDA